MNNPMNALPICIGLVSSALAALTIAPRERLSSTAPRESVSFTHTAPPLRTDYDLGYEPLAQKFADDPEAARQRVLADIEGYALATEAMTRRCGQARSYLRTRLQALSEHVDYARAEAVQLPVSEGAPNFSSAHAHFFRTISGLREAFTQALNEMNDGT